MIRECRQHNAKVPIAPTHLMYHGEVLKQKRGAGFATHAGRIKKSSRNRSDKNRLRLGSHIKRKVVKDNFFSPILKFLQKSSMNIESLTRIKKWRSWYAGKNCTNTHWKFRQLCLDQKLQQLSIEYLLDTTLLTRKKTKINRLYTWESLKTSVLVYKIQSQLYINTTFQFWQTRQTIDTPSFKFLKFITQYWCSWGKN